MDDALFLVPTYGYQHQHQTIIPTPDDRKKDIFRNSPGFLGTPEQAQQIENLASCGMSKEEISRCLNIAPELLDMYYKYEVETGLSRVNAQVARVALGMALSGANADMTKFWLRTQAGWVEKKQVEHVGKNGGPIEFAEIKQRVMDQLNEALIEAEYVMIDDKKYEKPIIAAPQDDKVF